MTTDSPDSVSATTPPPEAGSAWLVLTTGDDIGVARYSEKFFVQSLSKLEESQRRRERLLSGRSPSPTQQPPSQPPSVPLLPVTVGTPLCTVTASPRREIQQQQNTPPLGTSPPMPIITGRGIPVPCLATSSSSTTPSLSVSGLQSSFGGPFSGNRPRSRSFLADSAVYFAGGTPRKSGDEDDFDAYEDLDNERAQQNAAFQQSHANQNGGVVSHHHSSSTSPVQSPPLAHSQSQSNFHAHSTSSGSLKVSPPPSPGNLPNGVVVSAVDPESLDRYDQPIMMPSTPPKKPPMPQPAITLTCGTPEPDSAEAKGKRTIAIAMDAVASAGMYTTPPSTLVPMPTQPPTEQGEAVEEYSPALRKPLEEPRNAAQSSMTSSGEREFDWNTAFQEARDAINQMSPNTHNAERMKAYGLMAQLAHDFVYTVQTYARILISEVYLPDNQKTIKPVTGKGFAGGKKYVVQGILFKFSVDDKGIYGSDGRAAKVAGHELRHLIGLSNVWEKSLSFPLMAIVDYRGFRVMGSALLPTSTQGTLILGSADAGDTIRDKVSDHERAVIAGVAKKLNIAEHTVGANGVRMYTPCDLEVHRGMDGRLYMLDFSRLMPPEKPRPDGPKTAYLYRLLRPEFVRKYRKPLCSDAFSKFITLHRTDDTAAIEERNYHNTQAERATEYLFNKVIPEFAARLVDIAKSGARFNLEKELHEAGINVRFLGRVLAGIDSFKRVPDELRSVVMLEMTARVIKCNVKRMLRKKMRMLRKPGEGVYRAFVVDRFNLVFSNSDDSIRFWTKAVIPELKIKFEPFLPPPVGDLKAAVGLPCLFCLCSQLLGLKWSKNTRDAVKKTPTFFNPRCPFLESDLEELQEKVKQLTLVEHSAGYVLRMQALESRTRRQRLMKLAVVRFENALTPDPDNRVTLRNLGDCLAALDEFERAEACYKRALNVRPNDPVTLYKYAICLEKEGKLDEAEEYYIRSLELDRNHANCVFTYADFLFHCRKNVDEAENFYLMAIEADDGNPHAHNNYGVLLAIARRQFDAAEDQFHLASCLPNSNDFHRMNYEKMQKLRSTFTVDTKP